MHYLHDHNKEILKEGSGGVRVGGEDIETEGKLREKRNTVSLVFCRQKQSGTVMHFLQYQKKLRNDSSLNSSGGIRFNFKIF